MLHSPHEATGQHVLHSRHWVNRATTERNNGSLYMTNTMSLCTPQQSCHGIVLSLLQIFLQRRRCRKKVDVIAAYSAGDDEPAEMLQRRHRVEPWHRIQQLHWRRCQTWGIGTKEVQKLSIPWVRHRTLHELHNRCSAMGLGLRVEAELPCVSKQMNKYK